MVSKPRLFWADDGASHAACLCLTFPGRGSNMQCTIASLIDSWLGASDTAQLIHLTGAPATVSAGWQMVVIPQVT